LPRFRYRAKRNPRETEEGLLAAESADAATRVLTSRGLFPLSVEEAPEDGGGSWSRALRSGRRGWPTGEQALFARQLGDLLSGGLTVDAALAVLEGQSRRADSRATVAALRDAVREGLPLSGALERQRGVFPVTLVSAVRAGEASGALEAVLQSCAELLEQEDAILRKVRDALTYPAVVGAVAIVTLVVLFSFVIPRITILYADLEQVLPLPTRVLLAMSGFVVGWGLPVVALLGGAAFLGVREYRRAEPFRVRVGDFLLGLPAVGRILALREIVRLSRILGTLVGGGVPVLDSIRHAAGSVGNARFRREVAELRPQIHEGKRLSEAMASSETLKGPLVAMVRVGEESGDLASALEKAARLHERELDGTLRRATTLLEPALIVVLGVFVSFVVFAMMLPILQMDLGVG